MIFAGDPTPWIPIWCIAAALIAALVLGILINPPPR